MSKNNPGEEKMAECEFQKAISIPFNDVEDRAKKQRFESRQ